MSVHDDDIPTNPNQPRHRQSIKVQMICFWKKADLRIDSMPTKENVYLDAIQLAAKSSSTSLLDSVSTWQLLLKLLVRPLRPFLALIGVSAGSSRKVDTFSRNPSHYTHIFVKAISTFPSWPKFAKLWAKMEMQHALK